MTNPPSHSLEGRWQPVYAELGGAPPQNFSTQGDEQLYLVNYRRIAKN